MLRTAVNSTVKIIVSVLIVVFCISAAALASDSAAELFTLWGIPFGHDAMDVADKLELDHGMQFSMTFYAASELTPAHTKINSADDANITLYGYPYHLSYDDYYDTFSLSFQFSGSWDDRVNGIDKVITGLFSKYGAPDRITLTVPSQPMNTVEPPRQSDYTFASALSGFDLEHVPADASIYFRINNIIGTANFRDEDDVSDLMIEFHSKATLIRGDEDFDTF